MAETKPTVVERPIPPGKGEKTPLDTSLEDKIAKARANFEQSHADLFPKQLDGTDTASPEATPPASPPAEAPAIGEIDATDQPAPAEPEPSAPAPEAAKPAEPQPAPTEPSLAERKDNRDYRDIRKMERELRRLDKQLEERRKQVEAATAQPAPVQAPAPVAQPAPQPTDDDPLGIKATVQEQFTKFSQDQQAAQAARDAQAEEDRTRNQLNVEETAFRQSHPDYDDAIAHMVMMERTRYQRSGGALVDGNILMNDPKMAPVIEKIADTFVAIPHPDRAGVVLYADRTKLGADQLVNAREISDTEAAQALATDLWIGQQRNKIIKGAQAQGRPIPEVVWEVAKEMMYTPKPPLATANSAPAPAAAPAGQSVAEKIRQQARAAAAGKSLSSVTTSGAVTGTPVITTLTQLMKFRAEDPKAYSEYVATMSRRDPNWHRNLSP